MLPSSGPPGSCTVANVGPIGVATNVSSFSAVTPGSGSGSSNALTRGLYAVSPSQSAMHGSAASVQPSSKDFPVRFLCVCVCGETASN